MPTTITIDPVTRIEGHLEVRATVDMVDGEQQVIEAHSAGTMFRGFEIILAGRDPRDAAQYTQRICGVCPVSHAMAACLNLDNAFGVTIPHNARILRNLVLGANYIQSHLLHFYHLTALDYIDTTGLLEGSPWTPRNVTPDMLTGQDAAVLVQHYLDALRMRRKAHQMGAVFGGKLPCTGSFVVGGMTETVTAGRIAAFRALLDTLRAFTDQMYLPDVNMIAARFPEYFQRGVGNGNMFAFGVFDQNADGSNKLLPGGRRTDGVAQSVDPAEITEHVTHSWFTSACDDCNPAQGETIPDVDKEGAYSWVKAPRYAAKPHEVGPVARMWISDHYSNGTSVMDRTVARATETKVIADAMDGWLDDLVVGGPVRAPSAIPVQATSMGLTEAPRGALGHWMDIENSVISRYQVVTPTSWNASPRDHLDQMGPVEDALVGTPVADLSQPVEVLRIVHSFDPCLACAVHLVRPGDRTGGARVLVRPGIA